MKQLTVLNGNAIVEMNLPTSIKEFKDDYLLNVTSHLTIADNYSLIGLVYHDKLKRLIISARTEKKNASIGVIPIFIKAGNTDVEFIKNAKLKDIVVITNSQLSLGIHAPAPSNKLSLSKFSDIVCGAPRDFFDSIYQEEDEGEVMFIEFKIVPNVDIIAFSNGVGGNIKDDSYVKITPSTSVAEA